MLTRSTKLDCPADASPEPDLALNVTILYQDSLTLHWATELWDRLGELIGSGGIRSKTWRLSHLERPGVFSEAAQAAAQAHVLVVSVRDDEDLPMSLYAWTDAWMPKRVGLGGALVALIGVAPQPSHQSGRAHAHLAAVARRAGLDFLPDERKLPGGSCVGSSPAKECRQSVQRWPAPGRRAAITRVRPLTGGLSEGAVSPGCVFGPQDRRERSRE